MNPKILILLLIFQSAISQNVSITGHLRDAESHVPVIAASVSVKGSSMGTVANEEGNFQLTTAPGSVIVISCLGYKTVAVDISQFNDGNAIIDMHQDAQILEDVVVSKIPIEQLLAQVVKTSSERFNKPIVLNTYYREFVKHNGRYTKFADGLLDYHISGTSKNIKSDITIRQNRSARINLPDEDGNQVDPDSMIGVDKVTESDYTFSYIQKPLLNSKNYKNYDLTLRARKGSDGKELYTIHFDPKAEVKKALYKGSVTFDPETNLIYESEIFMAPTHMQYVKTINVLIIKLAIEDVKIKSGFKMAGNNYLLSHDNRMVKLKFWNKKKFNETIESRSDLVVTDFAPDRPYNKADVYKERSLYSKPSDYSGKFWQENNAIVLTSEEESIIRKLESAEEKPAAN